MGAVLVTIGIGLKVLAGKKDLLSRYMLRSCLPAFVTVTAHIFIIFAWDHLSALIFYAFYFSCANWLNIAILDFTLQYSESRLRHRVLRVLTYLLGVVDTVCVFVNILVPILFTVHTTSYFGEAFYRYDPTLLFLIHVLFGYLILLVCFGILCVRYVRTVSFFKIRYRYFLVFLFLIIASNVLYIFTNSPFNFSILFYAACFAGAYQLVSAVFPTLLVRKTLGYITDSLKNGIILGNKEGKCLYVNEFVSRMFGCDKDTILHHPIIANYLSMKSSIAVDEEATFIQEFEIEKDEIKYTLKISDYTIKEEHEIIGRYMLIENITDEKRQVYEQKILRTRDTLTGIYNKDHFIERAEHRLKFDRFTPYYLIVTDLVNFKLINDLYGKKSGDDILIRIADSLRRYCAADDLYGRLYNDHFVMLVPKRHFHEESWLAAFQMNMSYMNNVSYTVVGHMGLYEVDDLSTPVTVMCDRAFLALKTIKNDYRNCFAYYDDALRKEVMQMQMLMNELPKALEYGEVVMYLQPQFTKELKVVGAEALVRWHHPVKGVIPPSDFIEIIEKINIISDVDRYVWECACKKLAEWKAQGREDLYISVNISPKDFYTLDLYEVLTGLVKKYGISPSRLNLEITETAVIMDLQNQVKLLDKLRDFGFLVEMDDFGSGYSSLNMLKDISVDVLKIDMGFLQKSQNDKKSRLILEKIIVLAKELGMKVVTEGVENVHQIDFLSEFGCDLFQGFYFSRPIPVSDFEERYFK